MQTQALVEIEIERLQHLGRVGTDTICPVDHRLAERALVDIHPSLNEATLTPDGHLIVDDEEEDAEWI